MVEEVEHCFLDLKKVGLEKEMNSASMVSYIERVLPAMQKREWVIYSDIHKDSKDLFMLLMDFLLREKRVLEYMSADIRLSKSNVKGACNSTAGQVNAENETGVSLAINQLTQNQAEIRETLAGLSLAIASFNRGERSNDSKAVNITSPRCWVHESNGHTTAECFEFQKMSATYRVEFRKKRVFVSFV